MNSYDDQIKLYRLVSSKIDLENPGLFYFKKSSELDKKYLNNKKGDMYILTVKCDSSNIDVKKTEIESIKNDNNSIVVIKNDKKCSILKIEPYKK